ncbi:MAG TPA: cytochrome c oxidase subunit II [Gemmatimonadaceae bacterium]|nr:cytochrome c oxidase subunit II [Gemmatimonadaceae bacterium]
MPDRSWHSVPRCATRLVAAAVRAARSRAYLTPLAGLALVACRADPLPQSTLDAAGPDARIILQMHWVLTAIATLVSIGIIAATVIALRRRRSERGTAPPLPLAPSVFAEHEETRRRTGEPAPQVGAGMDEPFTPVELDAPQRDGGVLKLVLAGGAVFPAVVLVGLFVYVMVVLAEVDRPAPADALTIEVTGRQFWWEVHYYDAAGRRLLETANEIHIPVGEEVRVRLRSPDVIHSFWVPRLAGKLDMIPGRTNEFAISADSSGVYRGQCAEYCGVQHAKMAMLLVAQAPDEFAAWMEAQAADAVPAADPLAARGEAVFLASACAACHAVRGTPATGDLGPDLTHVASRRTLAALAIPNTRGHMGGWLVNPQAIKPGAHMPAVPMTREEFDAVLAYMMSLR